MYNAHAHQCYFNRVSDPPLTIMTPKLKINQHTYRSECMRSFEIYFMDIMNRMSLNVNDYFNDRIGLCDSSLVNVGNRVNITSTVIDQPQVFSIMLYSETKSQRIEQQVKFSNVPGRMCHKIRAECTSANDSAKGCIWS